MSKSYSDAEYVARSIINRLDKSVIIGVPLGLGKPIQLLNALFRLAVADQSIQLTIITGLTLTRPILNHFLEKRFVEPIVDRLLKDYEDPIYEKYRILQQLPANIKVIEFYLSPGKYLYNNNVQQDYISSNYSNVIRDLQYYSVNVLAQQFVRSTENKNQYSVSCNSDLFYEMLSALQKVPYKTAVVAEINQNLPFMHGEHAVFSEENFTDIIDAGQYRALFSLPRNKILPQEQLIGLYTSTLIKDGGCLQIGIGKLGDAIASALILRHKHNDIYLEILNELSVIDKFGEIISSSGELQPFKKGLYAATEMFSDEYIELYKEDILKKRVYDHVGLQKLLNQDLLEEEINPSILDILQKNKIINSKLTILDIEFLKKFGILITDLHYNDGNIILANGKIIPADLSIISAKEQIIKNCLGKKLKNGKILHAGFFLGSNNFYKTLKNLPLDELTQFEMTTIERTNTMNWSYELSQLQRKFGRYVNSSMMVTLNGNIISDSLKDMQEVSGVGGQFDLVSMAQKLDQARAIINCRSTRIHQNKTISNIIWDYTNATLPRHLRDIIITEYGIADCRGKTEIELIKSILNITDSKFQTTLLNKAKKAGKMIKYYEIPDCFKQNNPEKNISILKRFQKQGFFKKYPFGSDFTLEEQHLEQALLYLKNTPRLMLLYFIAQSFFIKEKTYKKYLDRMSLSNPKNLKEYFYKKILIYALSKISYEV